MAIRRIFYLILSMIFVFSFSVPIEAVTISAASGSASADVTAKYTEGVVVDTYSVEITWGSMEFEYKGPTMKWDPIKHQYTSQNDGTWSCAADANQITVKNHSSKPISVALNYISENAYSSIQGAFGTTATSLAAATASSVPSFSTTLSLSGALSSSVTTLTKIGSVTVSIGAATENSGSADSGSGNEPTPAGYLRLYSRHENDPSDYSYDIYMQSEGVYVATINATEVVPESMGPDTEIYIGDDVYYIYEADLGNARYTFEPGTTVNINTSQYDDGGENTRYKTTGVEQGKTYTLTINTTTLKATLAEVTE